MSQAASARRQAALDPATAEVQQALGLALAGSSGLGAALTPLRRAVWLAPGSVEVQINLGIACLESGVYAEAAGCFRRVGAASPGDPDSHQGLGVADSGVGRAGEAVRHLRRADTIRPAYPETLVRLASALLAIKCPAAAATCERRAIALAPGRMPAHFDLGSALSTLEQHRASVTCSLRALALDPGAIKAAINVAASLLVLGRAGEAIARLRRAAETREAGADAFRTYLAALSYDPKPDEAQRWAAARRFAARFGAKTRASEFRVSREPERRLRLAYLSSDLYEHAVIRCLGPLLQAHDRNRFEIACYAASDHADATTARVRQAVHRWATVTRLSDAEIAALMRSDEIDVLIVVAGRFDRNRPLVASHCAAPVQVSLFDAATSGLDEMDFLIADRILVPARTVRAERFSERVVRLPSLHLYGPPPHAAAPPPCLARGHVTFASFANPMKIGDETLTLWGRVLNELPGSRLLLKYMDRYADADLRRRVTALLGVDPERIRFMAGTGSLDRHLRLYDDVDIALDTLPFSGSTTTWEALSAGVPVVTRLGGNLIGRLSASLLAPIWRGELIAATPDEFVRVACGLAGNRDRLRQLRVSLPEAIARSPLCDARARARQFERVYRALWRRWCGSRVFAGPDTMLSGS